MVKILLLREQQEDEETEKEVRVFESARMQASMAIWHFGTSASAKVMQAAIDAGADISLLPAMDEADW